MDLISKEFNPKNRRSIKNLNDILSYLEEEKVYRNEKEAGIFGIYTKDAIKRVTSNIEIMEKDQLSEKVIKKINQAFIIKKYSEKNNINRLHKNLNILNKKGYIKSDLSKEELDNNILGSTSSQAIKSFQKRYKLTETGKIDIETEKKLKSVIDSVTSRKPQAKKLMKNINPKDSKRVVNKLTINMSNEQVANLQKGLNSLGYKVYQEEYQAQKYGNTTKKAIEAFQNKAKLPITGEVNKATAAALNKALLDVNPDLMVDNKIRVRGRVRDILWKGIKGVKVRVYMNELGGKQVFLGETQTFDNGFYNIKIMPPIDPYKSLLSLNVKMILGERELLDKSYPNVKKILWANYTEGDDKYLGISEYELLEKTILPIINNAKINIINLEESDKRKDIQFLSKETSISPSRIMYLLLSYRIAKEINFPELTPQLFYAFLSQNVLPEITKTLFPDEPYQWQEWIRDKTDNLVMGIIFLDSEIQHEVLGNAIKLNYVSRELKFNFDKILNTLKEVQNEFVLTKPILVGEANLQELLDITNNQAVENKSKEVGQAFIRAQGINYDFWRELQVTAKLDDNSIEDMKEVFDLGLATSNYIPMMKSLKNMLGDSENRQINYVRDLAKIEHRDWTKFISDNVGTIPEDIQDVETYALFIEEQIERMYPDISLIANVDRNIDTKLSHLPEISKFIDAHSDFNLYGDNIDKYASKNSQVLSDNSINELKVLQRIHRITPKAKIGTALIGEKLYNSLQIYSLGEERLIKRLAARNIDKIDARKIYSVAEEKYADTLALITNFRRELQFVNPAAVADIVYSSQEIEEFKKDIPNIEMLFGSTDYIYSEHCSSLYGPAAYLTDLLRFLGEKEAVEDKKNVQDILFDRRPDIGNILLNCENTSKEIPYIDLINEILENAIPPENTDFNHQSTLTIDELRAMPEHTRIEAYELLKKAKYPIIENFNLWQEEARMYLSHLGIERYKLMETFRKNDSSNELIDQEVEIAAEYFGISTNELKLILPLESESNTIKQNEYWDLDTSQDKISVTSLCEKAKISYQELMELLQVKYVNPPDNKSVILRSIDESDVSKQKVNNLDVSKFDRMHRFIRLWRHTGWEIWELDLLIRNKNMRDETIYDDAINQECLTLLRRFKDLQDEIHVSVEEGLAFFGDINIEARTDFNLDKIKPLYDLIFLNPTFGSGSDSSLDISSASGALEDYKAKITSCLAIGEDDFDLLKSKTDGLLTLESLSLIYRYLLLGRKLRLKAEELLLLMEVSGLSDPFSSLDEVLNLIIYHKDIKRSGFTLEELVYILGVDNEILIGYSEENTTRQIERLRSDLFELKSDIHNPNELVRDRTDRYLRKVSVFVSNETLVKALDLIEGKWEDSESSRLEFIEEYFEICIPKVENPQMILTKEDFLDNSNSQRESEILERYNFVLGFLYPYLNENSISNRIANDFDITFESAEILLDNLELPNKGINLRQVIKNESLVQIDLEDEFSFEINSTNFAEIFESYKLLKKASMLVNGFNLDYIEVEWFINNCDKVNTLCFNDLNVSNNVNESYFKLWLNMLKLIQFKQHFSEKGDYLFYEILHLASREETLLNHIFSKLSSLTGWQEEEIKEVHEVLGLKHQNGNLDYINLSTYYKLWECFKIMEKIKAKGKQISHWAIRNEELDQEIAREIKLFAKSKYEIAEWLEKLKPIQDKLREKKRSALTAYLIENSLRREPVLIEDIPNPKYWTNENDLCNHFLIDVEMNSCQQTSRIKQAISSVQFFIQRCFLNRENYYVKVPLEDPDMNNSWSQWKWMKNYRIWEANRKVFLYPENWIEPDLRDDKSPIFKELENDILQADITHENVERAYLNYLEKVDEVARLTIVSVYNAREESSDLLYIIGRTNSIPYTYYYRTFDINLNKWTPWDKINVDISSDNVIPVIYNRKLHLFWLSFSEKPIKIEKNPGLEVNSNNDGSLSVPPTENPEPAMFLEIQLTWTIKRHDGWSTRFISTEKIIHPWERPKSSYHVKPRYKPADNTLWIDLFISTSKEFNEGMFFDQYKNKKVEKTRSPFNEEYLPWHSSSFIFDGEVVKVKLKGMLGDYGKTKIIDKKKYVVLSSSYEYVNENFGRDGEAIEKMGYFEIANQLKLPYGMHYEFNALNNNKHDSINPNKLNIIQSGDKSVTLLNSAKKPFRAIIPYQRYGDTAFIYQDNARSFLVKPEIKERSFILPGTQYTIKTEKFRFGFYPLYHPYTPLFIRELNRSGLDGLLTRQIQINPKTLNYQEFDFDKFYEPKFPGEADETAKKEIVDFTFSGAYSIYNWEMFFHVPMLIAARLSQNQRFEEAMRWYHYIFDPTNIEDLPTPQRYWLTKPFYEMTDKDYRLQRIKDLINKIDGYKDQVSAWKNNPFKPHLIARYRPVAYQRNVVMKYIDNLIAWADQLYRQDSMESINEASLIYMLCKELLGERPEKIPGIKRNDKTFRELNEDDSIDIMGNDKVEIAAENLITTRKRVVKGYTINEPLPKLEINYFSIPCNDKLLGYWDLVDDRLYKIRNCMNIEGIKRTLSLFQPPIDPSQLVKAASSGISSFASLADFSLPSPNYRFKILYQAAVKFCKEVKNLGERLQSVLETKDAQGLEVLRYTHEESLLNAINEIKKLQIEETKESIVGLNESLDAVQKKIKFHNMEANVWEELASYLHISSNAIKYTIIGIEKIVALVHMIPQFEVGGEGVGGSPRATAQQGGQGKGLSMEAVSKSASKLSEYLKSAGDLAASQGKKEKDKEKNKLDKELREIEKKQIESSIKAVQIKLSICEKEKENQELNIDNLKTESEYFKNKYTNQELYNWMLSQISSIYFNAYQLAYDMSKRAEKSFQYELGLMESSYIQYGHWDSLRKGLMSGDKLLQNLYQLETAYYDQNKREMELNKHISLAEIAPWALIELKTRGECVLELPEWIFDMDYPGHYMRRIKSVSITIPCKKDIYTGVHCTLSLHNSRVRISNIVSSSYEMSDANDNRFNSEYGTIKSIATSHGQNDSGLFELNYSDDRFLPFEGSGVISTWGIKMPQANNQFDFDSISDIVMHVQYTARNGGGNLENAAQEYVESILPDNGIQLFSLKEDFPEAWKIFKLHEDPNTDQKLEIEMNSNRYPFYSQKMKNLEITELRVLVSSKEEDNYWMEVQLPGQSTPEKFEIPKDNTLNDVPFKIYEIPSPSEGRGLWNIKIRRNSDNNFKVLPKEQIDDIVLIVSFNATL